MVGLVVATATAAAAAAVVAEEDAAAEGNNFNSKSKQMNFGEQRSNLLHRKLNFAGCGNRLLSLRKLRTVAQTTPHGILVNFSKG